MINIIIASIPALLSIALFLSLDKKILKEKWLFLITILIISAIGSYICYRLEMHFGSYFKKVSQSTYLEILLYAIFGVAIFEEGYKWLITTIAIFLDKKMKMTTILIYSAFSSIGFAWFENIVYYAIPYGITTSITRMFSAFPSHIINSIFMAYFLIKYKDSEKFKKKLFLICSLIFPTIVHGGYNSFLYGNHQEYIKYHKIYLIIIFIASILLLVSIIKKQKNNSH